MALLIWIFLAVLAGVLIPGPGLFLKRVSVVGPAVFLIFLFTGRNLEPKSFLEAARNVRGLVMALVSINLVCPVLAFVLARALGLGQGGYAGLMVVATAPTTLASGIIISVSAGGSAPLAMLITLAASLAGVFIQPFNLKLFLSVGRSVDLAAAPLLIKLFAVMVVPTSIGIYLNRRVGPPGRVMAFLSEEGPKALIALIVYTAVATALQRLLEPRAVLLGIIGAALALHSAVLLINYGAGRIFGLPEPDHKSFTIVTSQKTLPLSLFICLNHLAHLPLAPIAPLAYHLFQIPLDSVVAHLWKRGSRSAGHPPPNG